MANSRSLKKQRIVELEREVKQLLQRQPKIVLGTPDIEDFLGGRKLIDGVDTMEILRGLAKQNNWSLFVFDYGARVRLGVSGQTPQPNGCLPPPTRRREVIAG